MIVGCISCYREGPLVRSAATSLLEACRHVYVLEGPAGPALQAGEETELAPLRGTNRTKVELGEWTDEASKRNYALERVRLHWPKANWLVILDGDELLLDGRFLPDLVWAATRSTDEMVGSVPLLVTEADGSVGKIHRVFNLHLLRRHVVSMSQFLFEGFEGIVTLPNLPVWRPGEQETEIARRPLAGEPHIHHRPYYRPPRRLEQRLHRVEMDDFEALEQEHLAAIGATPIFLPPGVR